MLVQNGLGAAVRAQVSQRFLRERSLQHSRLVSGHPQVIPIGDRFSDHVDLVIGEPEYVAVQRLVIGRVAVGQIEQIRNVFFQNLEVGDPPSCPRDWVAMSNAALSLRIVTAHVSSRA